MTLIRRTTLGLITIIMYFLAGPGRACALGFRVPNQDAFATSRGNAFVATADNPSALYYNPAGIVQLAGHHVQAETYLISLSAKYKAAGGGSVSNDDATQPVPQFFYVYSPPANTTALGLGVYAPYGLKNGWPEDSGFRTVTTDAELVFLTVNPVFAWRFNDSVSAGLGLTINNARVDIRTGIGMVANDEFRFEGNDTAYGFNAGLLWHVNERHVIGLSYFSRNECNFRGKATVFPLAFQEPARASYPIPDNIIVGYSFRPTPAWNIELDIDWTNWDVLDTVTLKKATGNLVFDFDYESSFFYELGFTRYFPGGWHVSGGYIFSENSVPDRTFNPMVPDTDSHLLSVGAGRKRGRVQWDVTFQYGSGPTRRVTGSPVSAAGESADGKYEVSTTAGAVSVTLAF